MLIDYEPMYNTTKGRLRDVIETFEQQLAALGDPIQKRFEFLIETLNGNGTWTSAMFENFPEYESAINDFNEQINTKLTNSLREIIYNPSVLEENYKAHEQRIIQLIEEKRKFLFFAHSQGNLFADHAFKFTAPKAGNNNIRVVHVAPATSALHGQYTLADQDIIINVLLRRLTSIPQKNVDIPPLWRQRPPPLDLSGHKLFETYLNTEMTPFIIIKSHIESALEDLFSLPCQEPPPPTPSGFEKYLPTLLAGTTYQSSQCLKSGGIVQPGTLTLASQGTFLGTGCFAGFSSSPNMNYTFRQYDYNSCSYKPASGGDCRAELEVNGVQDTFFFERGITRLNFIPSARWTPGTRPISWNDLTRSKPLRVDAKERILGWVKMIPAVGCAKVPASSITMADHRFEVTGDVIQLIGPNGLVASLDSNLVVGDTFLEGYATATGTAPPSHLVQSRGYKPGLYPYYWNSGFFLDAGGVTGFGAAFSFIPPGGGVIEMICQQVR